MAEQLDSRHSLFPSRCPFDNAFPQKKSASPLHRLLNAPQRYYPRPLRHSILFHYVRSTRSLPSSSRRGILHTRSPFQSQKLILQSSELLDNHPPLRPTIN